MANWTGTARSNYVRVADMEGLKKALEPFGAIGVYPKNPGAALVNGEMVCFVAENDGDGWPSFGYEDAVGEDGETTEVELEFTFEERVVPFLTPGEVLIVMEAGAEKVRYISGYAAAFQWDGQEAKSVYLSLNDIYGRAANEFGVNQETISAASY